MQIGSYEIRLEKRVGLTPLQAALISGLAVVFALALFSVVLLIDGVSPVEGYQEIFSYGFANTSGLVPTISRAVFLLLCTIAFIIPYRAGLWNIGMTGQLYMGSIAAFSVVLLFGGRLSRSAELSPAVVIPLMMLAAMVVQKLSMVIQFGNSQAVSESMSALTTIAKRPSVRMTRGQVRTKTMGRMMALTNPKTADTTNRPRSP